MRRVLIAALLLLDVGVAARVARAEPEPSVVAVLPLTTHDRRLELYTAAVATALARELGGLAGARVEAVLPAEPVPTRVDLVVGGHLAQTRRGVTIQFTVRDPELGAPVATLSTRAAPIERIDRLVADTGAELRDVLTRELATQRRRRDERAAPIRLPVTIVEGEPAAAVAPAPAGEPPRIAVLLATVIGDHGVVPVSEIATAACFDVARRLGFEPIAAQEREIGSFDEAARLARQIGAVAALKVSVRQLRFDFDGVMMARGRLRVMLVSPSGERLFDGVINTDTVIGSRGDRVDALVRFVADQAVDIAYPRLEKALSR